jgi:hypothetical protein
MFGFIKDALSGGITKSLENIALEFIETDKESAEAQALIAKVLDPNGKMRRDQSNNVGGMYKFYLISASVMIFMELIYSMYMGDKLREADYVLLAISNATSTIKDLFVPITALYGSITAASFGVNSINSFKGK